MIEDFLAIAKVLGPAAAGTGLFVWVMASQRVADMVMKWRSQSADLVGVKAKLQIEADLQIAKARNEFTEGLRGDLRAARAEVVALHEEVAKWMRSDRKCRDEVHELRGKMNTLILQNQLMAEQNTTLAITGDRATKLLDALEKHQPEWFGQERRNGDRRSKPEPPKETT